MGQNGLQVTGRRVKDENRREVKSSTSRLATISLLIVLIDNNIVVLLKAVKNDLDFMGYFRLSGCERVSAH